MNSDEFFMNVALEEAKLAFNEGEIPVGAVIVVRGKIVSRAHNTRKQDNKVTSHAEINAILNLEQAQNTCIIDNATLYTTLEPCPMCSYAILESHIKRVVYGAKDEKRGGISTLDIFNKKLGPKIEICGNILDEESSNLLKTFFKDKR